MTQHEDSTETLVNSATAIEAVKRGYQPVPLISGGKRARLPGWQRLRWENTPEGLAEVQEKFDQWAEEGQGGIGVLLGEPSGDLVDVDLDHKSAYRLKDYFLPPTKMRSGRLSAPNTHFWYVAEPGTLQETRTYKLPKTEPADKQMIVEYRSTGAQTAIPGNIHPDGDAYVWSGTPWGGEAGPTRVDGRMLGLQVALLGFCSLLVNFWPNEGARHEAYLALAGGLLKVGDGVHPYWERNAHLVIGALAHATHDDEGPEGRINEVLGSTLKRIRSGGLVQGFGKLGEILGEDAVRQAKVLLAEVESLAGVPSRTSGSLSIEGITASIEEKEAERVARIEAAEAAAAGGRKARKARKQAEEAAEDTEEPKLRDPLGERIGTWEAVDIDPYLTDQVATVDPAVMHRTDGQALMYPGRLNMLYGPSESAKSWIAMATALQMMELGERVVYLDFEDEPVNALQRMRLLGADVDDLRNLFSYVHPEEPLAPMMRSKWGEEVHDDKAKMNLALFEKLLEAKDPALIVADGMTVLYSLHGLDSNDSVQTDTITSWLKDLTRNGRSTVIIVDHTAKNPSRGSLPIGSQHKVAMVMGTLLQAYPVRQPMPGDVGEVELIVLKDRPGQVRKIAEKSGEKAQLAARVLIDSKTSDTHTDLKFTPPPAPTVGAQKAPSASAKVDLDLRQSKAAERSEMAAKKREDEDQSILTLFGGDIEKSLTGNEIRASLFGSEETAADRRKFYAIMARLKKNGWVHQEGSTVASEYFLTIGIIDDDD